MKTWHKWVLGGVFALLTSGGVVAGFIHQQREIGRRDIMLKASKVSEEVWRDEAKEARRSLEESIGSYTEPAIQYRTLRDTLVLTDTVAVKAALDAADTTIKACTSIVRDCTRTVVAQDSLIKALRDQNTIIRKSIPGRMSKTRDALVFGAIGVAVGVLVR